MNEGALIQCPQHFFSAFNATKTVHHTGTMICESHSLLADQDDRICQMDEYHPPAKVGVVIILFQFQNTRHYFEFALPEPKSL